MNAVVTAKLCAAIADRAFLHPATRPLESRQTLWGIKSGPNKKTYYRAQSQPIHATRKFLGGTVKIQLAPCQQKVI